MVAAALAAAPAGAAAQPSDSLTAAADTASPADTSAPERLRGFLQRKAAHRNGYFFALGDVERGRTPRLSDIVRNVPGLRLVTSNAAGSEVRIRGCRPLVWVDGVRNLATELDDAASANDVAGIEVYVSPSAIPAEFRDYRVPCGAILLWTRS